MRPTFWQPPVEPSAGEQTIIKRIRRAKLFVFLRQHRHELFDETFQEELAGLYQDSPLGQPPIAPAQLALATILQAYVGISDDEVIEATIMDRRWQLVVDCLDGTDSPFSKGTLVAFRKRLIEAQMDRRLIERTIEVAAATRAFGSRSLRAALDSSPLWGASRVEDTYNLLGHALRKALSVVHFPTETCAACPLRERCTTSARGRSVSIHPDEALLCELRKLQLTDMGRAKLRERVAVEHALAHIGRWQGRRARYRGLRKNRFDLRRTAVVHNLHVIARLPEQSQVEAA
jgi:Transposase DDE domain/Transposase domain (DUF772)